MSWGEGKRLEDYDFVAFVEEIKRAFPCGVVPIFGYMRSSPVAAVLEDVGFRKVVLMPRGVRTAKTYWVYKGMTDDEVLAIVEEWIDIGIPVNPPHR